MLSKIKKYRHGFIIAIYFVAYLILFGYLEQRPVRAYHVVHTVFDDMIPFCEIFIIPYLLWFPYVVMTVVYFLFRNKNKKEYFQLIFNLMMGMTVFLVVSYIYPNVQYLRPAVFPRSNIFTRLVAEIYRTDTPTNILPSIHVFNSLAVYFAIHHCQALKDRKWLQRGALILSVLIILSTMFIKQHSVIDVCLGTTLALFGHLLFYPQRVDDYEDKQLPYPICVRRSRNRIYKKKPRWGLFLIKSIKLLTDLIGCHKHLSSTSSGKIGHPSEETSPKLPVQSHILVFDVILQLLFFIQAFLRCSSYQHDRRNGCDDIQIAEHISTKSAVAHISLQIGVHHQFVYTDLLIDTLDHHFLIDRLIISSNKISIEIYIQIIEVFYIGKRLKRKQVILRRTYASEAPFHSHGEVLYGISWNA